MYASIFIKVQEKNTTQEYTVPLIVDTLEECMECMCTYFFKIKCMHCFCDKIVLRAHKVGCK